MTLASILTTNAVTDSKLQDPVAGRRLIIDPRMKFVLLLLVNMVVFNSHSAVGTVVLAIVTLGIVILIVADLGDRAGLIFSISAMTLWIMAYFAHWWDTGVMMIVGFMGYWLLRFFLSLSMAMWLIRTVTVSDFTESLYSLRVPRLLIIPLTVMFRFFPVVWAELSGIYEALLLRGYYGAKLWLHPVHTVELIIVPLLSATARIADELAAAAVMRGLGLHARPTRMQLIRFSMVDALLIPIIITIVVLNWWTPQVVVDLVVAGER